MAVQDEFGKLIGEKEEQIRSDLIFEFGDMPKLVIRSGANSIKWSYLLNTQTTPTLGGEVVQVLSCAVGPLTIEGTAAGFETTENAQPYQSGSYGRNGLTPVDEMTHIVQWFLKYMHRAGTNSHRYEKRGEGAIAFSYPARGWKFYIQVTGLQGLDIHSKQVGVPWSITAEIVNDPARDYLAVTTMNDITDSITSRRAFHQILGDNQQFGANPFVNPQLKGYELPLGDLASRLGDNFQALVASWVGGDFPHYGLSSPLADAGAQTGVTNPYDVYWPTLGGEYIGDVPLSDYGSPYFAASKGSETITGETSVAGEKWAIDVLTKLGYSNSTENSCFLSAWAYHEDNRPATATNPTQAASRFNWLNTTRAYPGAESVNSHGVKAYQSYEIGIQMTAETINQDTYYPNIIAGLASGNILEAANYDRIRDDLNTWGTGSHWGSIKRMADNCVQKKLQPSSSGLFKVTNVTPGDPYWGGSKEIADRFGSIAKQHGLTYSSNGKRPDNSGGGVSDHWVQSTLAYAYDMFGTTAQLDAAATAMALAAGKPWDFHAKAFVKWFEETRNGYRIQIGWRQIDHDPSDNPHVHLGIKRVG